MATSEQTVRGYLTALRDPDSLKDEQAIEGKTAELQQTDDVIERLKLQDELRDLRAPSLESAEDDFVGHAKAWADESGISADAFAAEGVSAAVLRRAGFQVGRSSRSRKSTSRKSGGSRVTTEEVVSAIPSDTFTVKQLRETSGASPAVVRKAIAQEEEAGRVAALGADPDHRGPGRAPTLYRRS
jgi:hypothetical protein